MARNIVSSDTDLTIAPTTKCALCIDGFFSESSSGEQHLVASHLVDEAVLKNAAKVVLSQVQERYANLCPIHIPHNQNLTSRNILHCSSFTLHVYNTSKTI